MAADVIPARTDWRRLAAAMVLALPLVAAVYANSLRNPFQFDDRHAIVENPALQTSAVDWSWWGARAGTIGAGHYRPVTFLSYAFNLRVGGLDPFGFHLVNVGLHWIAVATLMGALWLLGGRAGPAIVGGLVFAVTPANSEAVNYLAARSSLLVGLWSVTAVAAFALMRRCQAQARPRSTLAAGAVAVVALGLGLASKETAVTVPLLWICYDVGWSRRIGRGAVLRPYAVVAVLAVGYFAATGYWRALWTVLSGAQTGERAVWPNLWSQLAAFPLHATVFAWPFSLTVLHDVPTVDSPWRLSVFVGLVIALVACAGGAHWLVRASDARRPAGFLLLWWVIALVPLMLYPLHLMFQEHRDYFSWMALAGLAGLGLSAVWDHAARRPAGRWALGAAVVAVLAIWTVSTVERNRVWSDAMRLWSDAATKSPENAVAHVNLGTEYARRGDIDRALAEYRDVIRLQPDYGLAYHNVGLLYLGRGDYAEARPAFERAAELTPDAAEPLAALGTVYTALGERALADDALLRAAAALDRRPHPVSVRLTVADALAKTGRVREAVTHYQAVLARERGRPSFLSAKAYLGLGFLAERVGRREEALAAYTEALRIDPRLNDARYNMANVLLSAGRLPDAMAAYERLLAAEPKFFQARFNLGRIYEQAGRLDDARGQYRDFLRDAPEGPLYAGARQYAASRVASVEPEPATGKLAP
ncbi:MAG TPA: tetratricopeptide repeat protein [Nitrospiria bacterium]|nr:tetratricopeptide repeat protein [Nitrospiria bacterium]